MLLLSQRFNSTPMPSTAIRCGGRHTELVEEPVSRQELVNKHRQRLDFVVDNRCKFHAT
jgi:hypothetical protein